MIYTDLTKQAMQIAFDAHKDQKDLSGMPYIYHPFHLAENMTDECSVCVALLHDVVEDSGISLDELKNTFPQAVTDAIELLTHKNHDNYFDYIRSIKNNPIAVKVKLADLEHNSDAMRLDVIDEKTVKRLEKYAKAKRILTEEDGQISMF